MLKWSLAQLYKYNFKEFKFEDTLNFDEYVKDVDDIISMSDVKVSGKGINLYDDRYKFDLHLECLMTLECARTLEPVEYPISLDITEIFDTVDTNNYVEVDDSDEDVRVIEKNTIDLYDVIWEDVYLEKPMRVFKEGTLEFIDQYFDLEE